jgi:hypothetical protein
LAALPDCNVSVYGTHTDTSRVENCVHSHINEEGLEGFCTKNSMKMTVVVITMAALGEVTQTNMIISNCVVLLKEAKETLDFVAFSWLFLQQNCAM